MSDCFKRKKLITECIPVNIRIEYALNFILGILSQMFRSTEITMNMIE